MSNYLATVEFDDGERLLAVYNTTSDNLLGRSLLPDSPEARRSLAEGDRDKSEQFEAMHLAHYGETEEQREARLSDCLSGSAEPVTVRVPGYGASFRSQASRKHRLMTGSVHLPDGDWRIQSVEKPTPEPARWFRRILKR